MKKMNIDEYYIVPISRVTNITGCMHYKKRFERFSIANMKKKKHTYQGDIIWDALSGEKYYLNFSFLDINDMFIDNSFNCLPLNQLVNKDTNYMKKSEFLKFCRNVIIDLNSIILYGVEENTHNEEKTKRKNKIDL